MMQYFSEIMLIIVDYLVDPKDFFNLRRTDKQMRKCLPDRFGTTLEVFLRTADLMRNKQYVRGLKSVYLNITYFLYRVVSKELVFPYDCLQSGNYGLCKAMESVERSRKNSDRIDDEDILFLVDRCIAQASCESLDCILGTESLIDTFKDHRDWFLRNAFDMNFKNVFLAQSLIIHLRMSSLLRLAVLPTIRLRDE
jgi:hypothetical protein